VKLEESTICKAIDVLFYSFIAGFGFSLGVSMFSILVKKLSEHG